MGNDPGERGAGGHRFRLPALPPDVLPRPRLTRDILGASRVCVLSAPAGYGATTALIDALTSQELPVVWTSLEFDGEVTGGVWCVVAAALGVDVGDGDGPLVDSILDHLHAGPACWLILDGLDPVVSAGASSLSYFVRHLPTQVRLAVSTQWDPTVLGLASAEVRVVDESDLAMTADEAAALLLGMAPDLDIEQAEAVIQDCQGWALALMATARQARQRPGVDASRWLREIGVESLLAPWWQGLAPAERSLLAGTAFLDELHPGLVGAVLEDDGAPAVLEGLTRRRNQLLPNGPQTGTGRWWRRSRLLDQFLSRRREPHSGECHSRAADWLVAAGHLDEAIAQLRSAGRDDEAGRLLRKHEDEWLSRGESARALHAYEFGAPADTISRLAQLLRLGWAKALSGDRSGAEGALAELITLHAVATSDPTLGSGASHGWSDEPSLHDTNLEGEVRLFQAQIAGMAGDAGTMAASARAALDAFGEMSRRTSHQLAPILLARGLLWGGNIDAARTVTQQASRRPVPNDGLREAMLGALHAEILVADGRIYDALVVSERAMKWVRHTGADPMVMGDLTPLLAHISALSESGSLGRAAQLAGDVVAKCDGEGAVGPLVRALTLLARIELARGDLGAALGAIGRARRALRSSAPRSAMTIPLDMVEVAVRLAGGDLLRAERLALQLPAGEARTLLAASVAVRRHPQGPSRLLAEFKGSTPRFVADRHLILAAADLRRSSRLAEAHLVRAADIAISEGMALLLVGAGGELITFAEATARRLSHDGLAALASAAQNRSEVPGRSPGAAPPVQDLSRGELELLALLPGRETNAEIAAQLGITVNTVKTRVQRLYRKLGVSGRNEAVRLASARNLLPRGTGAGRVPPQG